MASTSDPQALYTKAVRAELAQSYDDAFRMYIRAAEGFLQSSRAQGEPGKSRAKKDAGKALERAERIKSARGAGGSGAESLRPVEVNFWSAEEQSRVLRNSSTMNGLPIPLWDDPTSDTWPATQPNLSPDQIARGATWRVLDLINHNGREDNIWEKLDAEGIVQHVVSDCSVCAALSVCTALQKRRPHVPIDHTLPIDANGTILGLSANSSATQTPVLWPSLVEKAYMKLMGGYDFPGSNSSIDFYVLSGWIPEHIEIRSPTFSREKVWARIVDAHDAADWEFGTKGQCVITLGTDVRASAPAIRQWTLEKWGRELLAEHNYAVVDVQDVNGERSLSILDSRIDRTLLATATDDSQRPKGFGKGRALRRTIAHASAAHRHLRLVVDNPTKRDQDVWVLLTRHQSDSSRKAEYIALHVHDEDEHRSDVHSIAEKAKFTSSVNVLVRMQIAASTKALSILASYDGPFEDVGFTLVVYTSATVAWDKTVSQAPFTHKESGSLTSKNAGGNCNYPTYMINPQYHLRIHPEKNSNEARHAGMKAKVVLAFEMARQTPLNITAVWSQGERVTELSQKEIAASSGPYGYGFVRADQQLQGAHLRVDIG
ncbi:hypothetical protein HWV62_44019 [Athelia sp. TMB]|nr:hypothetical protein HWV62_44019 [Athelia sp. TMB]